MQVGARPIWSFFMCVSLTETPAIYKLHVEVNNSSHVCACARVCVFLTFEHLGQCTSFTISDLMNSNRQFSRVHYNYILVHK